MASENRSDAFDEVIEQFCTVHTLTSFETPLPLFACSIRKDKIEMIENNSLNLFDCELSLKSRKELSDDSKQIVYSTLFEQSKSEI